MDLQRFLHCWAGALLLFMACGCQCMSVHILNEEPSYVIPGSRLTLQARIDHGPLEEVSALTWEREPEAGASTAKVTLASCAAEGPRCAGGGPGGRVSVDQQGATLRLEGFSPADSGVYALTVVDRRGAKTTAHCIVREYEAVHHVSVSINASHSSLVCGEAWGTDPAFSWLHERATVTPALGNVSEDGKTLLVAGGTLCGHFTCVVRNKLGYSSATYTAAPCDTEPRGTAAAVVCAVLLLLLLSGAALGVLLWRRRRRFSGRGERLREPLDDNI